MQKYHIRRETITAVIATTSTWQLDPTATDQQRQVCEDQLMAHRKIAKSAESDYIQHLMKFQYGADSIDLLPQENSNSLVPPDIREKLEAKKKETKLAA